ncbi:hypothetical protein RJ639_044514 [Escallonia herrerae]|uniref:PPIase cyclophilin-type domain-containing protein n=1 Tax=Escallonia herrerae TaxID=1293975 RepID=A0AA88WAD3_9ASTE|nr:hypothetical protein RJ639_044514 [Escallonia herrerae]
MQFQVKPRATSVNARGPVQKEAARLGFITPLGFVLALLQSLQHLCGAGAGAGAALYQAEVLELLLLFDDSIRNIDAGLTCIAKMNKVSKNHPLVFLDVSIDGDPCEKMVFELYSDVVPKTAENFRALCTGEMGISPKTGKPLHYKGSFFHRIIKGSMAQGVMEKAYMGTSFQVRLREFGDVGLGRVKDESAKLKHDEPGLLSMAIADRDARGSLFSVTFRANHHLDRLTCAYFSFLVKLFISIDLKYVVFGKLVQGHEVLKKIESVGDEEGRPTVTVKIVNCGEYSEGGNHEVRRKGKPKKSSKERRKKRRRHYETESDSSSDSETETSESESDSDLSSSDISSSSDDRRRKRKRSKRDRHRRGKRRDNRRERKRKRRDKRSKRRSKRASDSPTETESSTESSSEDNGDVRRPNRKHKHLSKITAGNKSSLAEEKEDVSLYPKKGEVSDMLEREEGEYPKENGEPQSNGIEVDNRSEKSADRQPDIVDDHPGKSRSRSLSPRRAPSKSMSISPKKSLSKSLSISPKRSVSRSQSVSRSPPHASRRGRSISRSPLKSESSRSPARSVSRSPVRAKKARSVTPISRSPTASPPRRSFSRSPPRTSSRKSSRKSASRSPVRSSRRSLTRSPVRSSRRSISRSSGKAPSRKSASRSPPRAFARNNRRSYSRSPIGVGRRARSPVDRGRSSSRSPSPDGSPKRIRRGRGFSERYSYARRYQTPERYRYGSRYDRDRYRARRSRTRSPSVSRSPIRHRTRRYSRSPVRNRSPVVTSRYRSSPAERRRAPSPSRSPSESKSSQDSESPKRASKENSRSSSASPPAKKGLVSYGDGSPDSGQR